jgi:hypothetical protein
VHSLIAVPIVFDRSPIGVLCAFDARPHPVSGEDLSLMQLMSRRGTSLLEAWVSGRLGQELPFRLGPGVATRPWFERILEVELRILIAAGGSLELVLADSTDLTAVHHAVATAPDPARLMAGVLTDGRIAIYKRDPANARAKLAPVIAALRASGAVEQVGIVDLGAGWLSSVHPEDILRLAERALDEAVATSSQVRRMVVTCELT